MSKNQVSVVTLPLSMLHENPWNPRSDFGNLDMLAKELRTQGQQDPIKVYEHPEISGEYRLLSGHRRRRAALRGDLGVLECLVVEMPANEKAAVYAEALTTGRNHKSLDIMEQGAAIQGLLDFETEEQVAAQFDIPKQEVRVRASLADREDLAARVADERIDLLALARYQEVMDACSDESLKVELENTIGRYYRLDVATMDRVLNRFEIRMAEKEESDRLAGLGAEVVTPLQGLRGEAGREIDPEDDDLTEEQHIEAGHRFGVSGDQVTWYEPVEAAEKQNRKPEESEAEKLKKFINAEKRRLDSELPAVMNIRERFVLGKVQDKKGMTEAKDRALMADLIVREARNDKDAEAFVAQAVGVEYPMLRSGEETYTSDFRTRVDKWWVKAEKALVRLQLGQQARILAAVKSARSDAQCNRFLGFSRGTDGGSSELEYQRWAPLRLWYERLVKFFGYTPDQAELDAIKVAALQASKEVDIDLPGLSSACRSCGTEPFEPTGADLCTGCAATDSGDA